MRLAAIGNTQLMKTQTMAECYQITNLSTNLFIDNFRQVTSFSVFCRFHKHLLFSKQGYMSLSATNPCAFIYNNYINFVSVLQITF